MLPAKMKLVCDRCSMLTSRRVHSLFNVLTDDGQVLLNITLLFTVVVCHKSTGSLGGLRRQHALQQRNYYPEWREMEQLPEGAMS